MDSFPSLISLVVSVDADTMLTYLRGLFRAQELCESRGGRPGLPSLWTYSNIERLNEEESELRTCVEVEVDVLGSRP